MVRPLNSVFWRSWQTAILAALFLSAAAGPARGQLAITEIMHNPSGSDALWEWIEVRNILAGPLNLDGWVIDDDDDGQFAAANIDAANGATIVPAGGVAVLYPGDEFDFMPQRFLDAWGNGITLIPVNGLTALTAADVLGLWPNHAAYLDDAIPMSTTSPRRTFAHAALSLNYTVDFPPAAAGRSIAWSGAGSPVSGLNWVESQLGQPNVVASQQTTIASAQINSTLDLGNPGAPPTGAAPPALVITEIMFAPQSPQVTVGFTETDFEWIEVYNNTGAAINFSSTRHVLDDDDGGNLITGNVAAGSLAAGATGILFNGNVIKLADMQTMWGSSLNYFAVSNWPSLNNDGDTLAIWDSLLDYNTEPTTGAGRTHQNAVAAVTYDTLAGQGWPTNNDQSSFYLKQLGNDPNAAASWARSAVDDAAGSRRAAAIFQTAIDHPGGDVGSPGFAPAMAAPNLAGDYNANGTVDATDYVVWRNNLNTSTTLPNDQTPGTVDAADYQVWRTNFGNSAGSGSATAITRVPEPAGAVLALIGCAAICVTRPRLRPARRSRPRSAGPLSRASDRQNRPPGPDRPAG